MTTRVLNYKRHKPLPAGSIYIGRANRYGCTGTYGNNHTPGRCDFCSKKFRIKVEHAPEEVLPLFKRELLVRLVEEGGLARSFLTLRGRDLLCGCVLEPWWPGKEGDEKPCHGRVIAEILEALPVDAVASDVVAYARAELARMAAEAVEEADARG